MSGRVASSVGPPLSDPARRVSGWQMGLIGGLLALKNFVDALSVNADYARIGLELAQWKPFVWEYSSGLMIWVLVPLLHWWLAVFPLTRALWWRSLPAHLLMTVPFSLIHVGGMVALRKAVYALTDDVYDFGPWWPNWRYEFNKDFATYWIVLALLLAIYGYAGRRNAPAKTGAGEIDDTAASAPIERVVVRKLNREYILTVKDIDRIDANGNYVALHVDGDVYPLRESLASLEKKLDGNRFVRVHRRHIVNIDSIREIQPWDNGDYRIVLEDGSLVNLSRRYRDGLNHLIR